ncbi:hypothetical protein DPMN_017748 [Dreissena polymorpha]|uniref:Uncharacterized protein n=1 Tax=Dreissena polymorpha TaxID=45954 RepID=A0A9D4NDV3_DREPO|nr:hypothetical protein DPMN_017748 [Dreissena polymorpha]
MCPVSCADGVVWIMWRVLYVSDVFVSVAWVYSGSCVVDMSMVMYSLCYVVAEPLSGAEEEEFVGCFTSVGQSWKAVSISVPRAQNTPPPHKRTHAERARAPRARIRPRPEPPTAGAFRDKHPHPPSCCAQQQISQEPTKEFPKATPGVTIVLSHPPPNIQSLYQAGLY